MFKISAVLFLLLVTPNSYASSTRIVPADSFISADTTKSYTHAYNTVDTFSCNSSTTAWTLSHVPQSTSASLVMIDGLIQTPTTDYTISSTTLTISPACTSSQTILVLYAF
jgi:hypothetical protein